MEDLFALTPVELMRQQAVAELRECNDFTGRYGLLLTEQQMLELVERRFAALEETGRVEFGEGILKKLLWAFCDSPYISADNYEDTVGELQETFYYFKNECLERYSDDELIEWMRLYFDTVCHGSLELLSGASLEELCRRARYDEAPEELDLYGNPLG